jgi:hypothetical protein
MLYVSASVFRAGQLQRLTADERDGLCFGLTQTAGRVLRVMRRAFGRVPQRDVCKLVKECLMRQRGNRRDGNASAFRVPLRIAV